MRRFLVLLALAASSLVVVVGPSAAANDTECVGALTGEFDNVVVPRELVCVLTDSTVHGNIKAFEGSALDVESSIVGGNITTLPDSRLAVSDSEVGGGVYGDLAQFVRVRGTTVHGDIEVVGRGPVPFAIAPGVFINSVFTLGNIKVQKMTGDLVITGDNVIGHNLQVEDNFIPSALGRLTVTSNEVGQNLQVNNNVGPGVKTVSGNTAHESLQCFGNEDPFVGTPNVAREAQGQCSAAPLPPGAVPPGGGGGIEV